MGVRGNLGARGFVVSGAGRDRCVFDCFDWAGRAVHAGQFSPSSISLTPWAGSWGRDTPWRLEGGGQQVGGDSVSQEQRGVGPPPGAVGSCLTRP